MDGERAEPSVTADDSDTDGEGGRDVGVGWNGMGARSVDRSAELYCPGGWAGSVHSTVCHLIELG